MVADATPATTSQAVDPFANFKVPKIQGAPIHHKETGPFIDGAKNPELIPDELAYSHFVRMLMARDNGAEAQKRQRAYVMHILRNAPPLDTVEDKRAITPPRAEIAAILQFAASHQPQLTALDREGPSDAADRLLVTAIVDSMHSHLGPELAARVDNYVKGQFKKNIKIIY